MGCADETTPPSTPKSHKKTAAIWLPFLCSSSDSGFAAVSGNNLRDFVGLRSHLHLAVGVFHLR